MSEYENNPLKPPRNIDLPFFAYGIFKPNQLAYSRIARFIRREYPEEINYDMLMRDGVPLIMPGKSNKIQYKTKGYLIYFNEEDSKKAYDIISRNQLEKLYKWEVIWVGENKANVLMGVNPELGSSYSEEFKVNYDGRKDPYFKEAIDVVEQELNDENKHWSKVDDFFKLQMAYMLLWSSIERYCSLRYDGQSIGKNNRKFSKEKAFSEGLKSYVKSERKVYSAADLREYTLNPEKPYDSIRYYYTIRCNTVHRGKALHNDEHMLRQSLTELLNIFKDVLDDTFENYEG
ncbi:hypothetical protein [Methanobrevibacter sp.]|uniref:hypothetical protein n=1 Tax=Methanobrevibacter sp. TaxID=66852 RepID=UPI00386FAAD0